VLGGRGHEDVVVSIVSEAAMATLPDRVNGVIKARGPGKPNALGVDSAMRIDAGETVALARVSSPRLLRFPAVRERTGLSRSTIWRLEQRGQFPRHHQISANVVAWSEDEVSGWIRARVAGE
jgi:prophage regulatory protein